MKSIAVVTGGTGFIGWNLCERLREQGFEVRAAVRPSSRNPLPDGVTRIDAGLSAESMAPAFEGAGVVFHLAGVTRAASQQEFMRINAEGSRQVALAARRADAFLVLVSSMAAGGTGTVDRPRREDDPDTPVSAYGESKLAGEQQVATVEGVRYAVVRPPGVYGPRDRDFLALFRMASRGMAPQLGLPDTSYTFVHVADAVASLLRVAEAGMARDDVVQGEAFYVGHPRPVTQAEMPAILAGAVGRRVRAVPVPRSLLRLIAEAGELGSLFGRPALINRNRYREMTAPGFVCDVSKIGRLLGWQARFDTPTGFAETARWYREQGWM